jgi:ABC-type dipeptide/oligopeptide/nickel transport system permease subunit
MAISTHKSVSLPNDGDASARAPAVIGQSPARRMWGRLRRNPAAMASAVVLLLLAVIALIVPRVVTIDPYQQNLADSLLPPGTSGHLLGTDHLGRDLVLRLIDGARVSLAMGFIAVGIAVIVGGMIGLIAGYCGGVIDGVLMRLIEVQLTFPGILFALVIVTILGSGLTKAMIAVGIASVPRFARVVRGSVLAARHELYVEAAKSIGASDRRVMFVHIVPQVLGPVITLATLGLANAILAGAALSFLGLGPQPPTAEWGLMLADSRKYLQVAWWLGVFPGLAIMIAVLAINLLGDGVRDAIDPRTE